MVLFLYILRQDKIGMAKKDGTVFLFAQVTVMICARKHLDAECVIL
jgi:hypothetical protein